MLFIFSKLVLIRHLWQFKTVVFLHWYVIHAALFTQSFLTSHLRHLPTSDNNQKPCYDYFSFNPKPIIIIIINLLKSIFPTTKYKSQAFSLVPNIKNNKKHFQESKHYNIELFIFITLFTWWKHHWIVSFCINTCTAFLNFFQK